MTYCSSILSGTELFSDKELIKRRICNVPETKSNISKNRKLKWLCPYNLGTKMLLYSIVYLQSSLVHCNF